MQSPLNMSLSESVTRPSSSSSSCSTMSAATLTMLDGLKRQLSEMKNQRDDKRKLMTDLFQKKKAIEDEMRQTEGHLMNLDDDIDTLERRVKEVYQQYKKQQKQRDPPANHIKKEFVENEAPTNNQMAVNAKTEEQQTRPLPALMQTQAEEILSDSFTQLQGPRGLVVPTQPEEHLPDPMTQLTQSVPRPDDDTADHDGHNRGRTSEGPTLVGPLHLVSASSVARRPAQASSDRSQGITTTRGEREIESSTPCTHEVTRPTGTLDDFFVPNSGRMLQHTAGSGHAVSSRSHSTGTPLQTAIDSQRRDHHSGLSVGRYNSSRNEFDPNERFRSDSFPWSHDVSRHLHQTFRIPSFRDHQKEIINATMSNDDVFVIMRTGGGKSLTYQMPALIEGRGPERKVTFVISPLLSLIQDQEEQMNEFVAGSAVSFTSGLQGGNAEHTRRWSLVQDREKGLCLVFVTPEKVHKSKRLQNELQKLYAQRRLGRFVIDECHCACQWGHDFRPDYAQLGILKSHFPSIPVIAVTATASDKVRDDVCQILRLGTNYRFFRSTANRPNLKYSVRPKKDGKDAVIMDMVAFIKEHHPRDAGIVYTFSRKDADTLADRFCDLGIVARAYHSDVSPTNKDMIHRSWMRNDTQVVVATIAFGLGINKPDVRFVLHHTISKTLDAYYQESGRAGRDGKDSNCVLYYSPKDVPRMLKMVHGSKSESLLWPMVRYGQVSGNDEVCRGIIMAHLGEPIGDVDEMCRKYDGIQTDLRDVGVHGQTVARLLHSKQQECQDVTVAMLVKEWRAKPEKAAPCVRNNPPAKDGLSIEDCERIIIALLLENVFEPNVVWGAYDSIVYLVLGQRGFGLLQSANPVIKIRFPKRDDKKPAAKQTAAKARKSLASDGEWYTASVKPKATKRKKTAPKKAPAKKKAKAAKPKKTVAKGKNPKAGTKKSVASKTMNAKAPSEVIDLYSDDDGDQVSMGPLSTMADAKDTLWEDDNSSDEEFEFE